MLSVSIVFGFGVRCLPGRRKTLVCRGGGRSVNPHLLGLTEFCWSAWTAAPLIFAISCPHFRAHLSRRRPLDRPRSRVRKTFLPTMGDVAARPTTGDHKLLRDAVVKCRRPLFLRVLRRGLPALQRPGRRRHGDLGRWRIAQSLSHAKHFAAFIEHNPDWSPRHGWCLDGTWTERPAPARQVVDWLGDPARKSEIEHAFFHFAGDEEDTALLSKVADDLARLYECHARVG
jgi:hypothetical protein